MVGRCTESLDRGRVARSTPRQSRGLRERQRGFTLIEMVVVIGIIALLAALTVAVSSTLTRKAEQRQAEDTLTLLEMALGEWENAADRQLSIGDPGAVLPDGSSGAYDFNESLFNPLSDADQELLMSRVMGWINKNQAANTILARIDADYVVRVDETAPATGTRMKLLDPWDKSYHIVIPGRKYFRGQEAGGVIEDDDGTIRTESEKRHGICINHKTAFVSAGPDGDFGDLDLGNAAPNPSAAADDNMYSSPVKTRLP